MPIDISKVEPGDLIFTYTGVDLAIPGTPTGHVMMAGDADDLGVATQIHQVRGSMTVKYPGTSRERLIPNSAKEPGEAASRKRILRARPNGLAAAAATLALRLQRSFQVEFSEDRVNAGARFEDLRKKEQPTILQDLRKHFNTTGKFRAIKYAARRNGFMSYPHEKGEPGKGMFCSMFVVLCYQIAGLVPYVKAANYEDTQLRISDKKMVPKDLKRIEKDAVKGKAGSCDSIDFAQYHRYTEKLKERDPYELGNVADSKPGERRKKLEYRPSIDYWDFTKCPSIANADWAGMFSKGMMVDSRIVMPRGLYDSLLNDGAGWEDLGDLTGKQSVEDWKEVATRAENVAMQVAERRKLWAKGKVG